MKENNNILADDIEKLVIYDEETKKELVVITSDQVKQASNILIKLTPMKNPTIKELKDIVIKELMNDKLYDDEYKNRVELLKVILDAEK